MKALTITGVIVIMFGLFVGSADAQQRKFKANLSGSEEVPPVDTVTTGKFTIKFDQGDTAAKFKLKVKNGDAITQAHLHCSEAGMNGPVVVFLFGNIPGGFNVNGKVAKFTLTDENVAAQSPDCDPVIGMAIEDLADLREAMENGDIYVNVHSVANPSGEVRGQVE